MGIIILVMNPEELHKKFEQVYKTRILPEIAPFEKERFKVRIQVVLLFAIAIAILALLFGQWSNTLSELVIYCIIIASIGSMRLGIFIGKKFTFKVKQNLLSEILKLFGDFYRLEKFKNLISLSEIQRSGLFYLADDKTDDDNIAGVYKGMSVAIVETELYHIVDSRKNRLKVTDFNGLIVKTTLNKPYQGRTLLFQKNAVDVNKNLGTKFLNAIMSFDKISKKAVPSDMEKVILEDACFNNVYEVYSDDQIESRYIITPTFMERLMNVRTVINASNIHCYFEDKYMTLYLSTGKNFFEVGSVFFTLYNKKRFEEVFVQLVSIFELIHYFKLDKKLGL